MLWASDGRQNNVVGFTGFTSSFSNRFKLLNSFPLGNILEKRKKVLKIQSVLKKKLQSREELVHGQKNWCYQKL